MMNSKFLLFDAFCMGVYCILTAKVCYNDILSALVMLQVNLHGV